MRNRSVMIKNEWKTASVVFFAAVWLLVGCRGKEGVTFEGEIQDAEGKYLTVSKINRNEVCFLDSVEIKKERFSITFPVENSEPAFYILSFDVHNAVTTLATKGEKVELGGFMHDFARHYTASGAKDAELMALLNRRLGLFADSVNHLYDVYVSDNDEKLHARVENAYLKIKENHRSFLLHFIHENPESLSIIAAFYQTYDYCAFFDEKKDMDILNHIYRNLKRAHPDNENVKALGQRISTF